MRLGHVERMLRRKAQPKPALLKRPDVIAEDGTAYEVVWYPHEHALSLLPPECATPSTLTPRPHRGERGWRTLPKPRAD